jgi:hypothetical protein
MERTNETETKSRSKIGLILGVVIVTLLVLGIVYLILFQAGFLGSGVKARTLTSVNLRQGPGIAYATNGGVLPDTEVTVIGRSQDGAWLLVRTDAGNDWMTANPEFVEIDAAIVQKLPVIEAPPLAFNAGSTQVYDVMNQIPLVVYHADHFTCASHAGLNNLMPSVVEGNVIGPHAGDFAFVGAEGNVLFEYTQGGLRLIRDNPIARFDGDQKSLPLNVALTMFETGEIDWTGNFGDWPGRGVPGCDESSQPD